MKKIFAIIVAISAMAFILGYFSHIYKPKSIINNLASPTPRPTPLAVYSIPNLTTANIKPGKISVTGSQFIMDFNPNLDNKTIKKVTGVINLPITKTSSKFPLIVMFRGFVDQKIYQPGIGTKRAAEFFSKNGYLTVALDFLGYGGSDSEAGNIFESRFQTYVTALTLLKSLDQFPDWDRKNIFIWGHSNGGQIALTIQEITGSTYPTVLWAPVSKPFPYSILYYTDESEDKGKLIRRELAKFEADYDVELYSLDNYLTQIKAPFQIHQGTADDAVPVDWTDTLVKKLKSNDLEVKYYRYQGSDHNLQPAWNMVITRDLEFYNSMLK